MTATWSSAATIPSPLQNGMDGKEAMQLKGDLTFVDFVPQVRDPGGLFTKPVFETFRTLIDRANEWLTVHRKWEVRTCESVEFKEKGEIVDHQKMTYLEYGENATWYIRGLRLWIVPRVKVGDTCQQIGYLNVIPKQIGENGFFSSMPSFETLNEVVERFNTTIETSPIPGRILTVESQQMKLSNSMKLDPDRSHWEERGSINRHFLFIIRVFFELVAGDPEEIGLADFTPDIETEGGVFSMPQYEPFSHVVKKASDWCIKQEGVRFCNAQSLEIKVKTGSEVDSQKMNYTEHGSKATFYIRILRVAYARPPSYLKTFENPRPSSITQITCKTFVPVQLTSGLFMPEFESLKETKSRVEAWVTATGVRVISVETAALRLLTGGEAKSGIETSFTFNQTEKDEYWIFVIRLYINGSFEEPPGEMLPPLPELQDQGCCILL